MQPSRQLQKRSQAQQELTRELNSVDSYTERYRIALSQFLEQIARISNFENAKRKIEYLINELEIYLLNTLKYALINDPDWIASRNDGIAFLLPEAFFIKRCKDILGMPREREFIYDTVDLYLPRVKKIISQCAPEQFHILFKETSANNFAKRITFFHDSIEQGTGKLIQMASSRSRSLMLYLKHKSEIDTLKNFTYDHYLSPRKFPETWNKLLNSITYRYERHDYLIAAMKAEHESHMKGTRLAALSALDEMNQDKDYLECLEEALQQDDITREERQLLREAKDTQRARYDATQLMLMPSPAPLEEGEDEDMDMTDEERMILYGPPLHASVGGPSGGS